MIAYVSIIAITNVCLGVLLARMLAVPAEPPSVPPVLQAEPRVRADIDLPDDILDPEKKAPATTAPAEEPAEEPEKKPPTVAEEPAEEPKPAAPGRIKSWTEFAVQMRDIQDRTRYCLMAQDMKLTQQAAEQMKACAIEWYSQFESCLRGEKLDDATQALVEGKSMMAVEMFAAQIETTLSNMNSLDFTLSVDEVVEILDREIELLYRQQRCVASSKPDA
ncbi:MAG: hypothetical protein IT425_06855 [Pirellulales bacterium]|nr:hypothetical protein [Pirellulales bacterium]